MQDAEDELEAGRQAEAKQRQDIDRELRRGETLKADRAEAKRRQQLADDDVAAVSALPAPPHPHTPTPPYHCSIIYLSKCFVIIPGSQGPSQHTKGYSKHTETDIQLRV